MSKFQISETNGIPVWIQVRRRLIYLIVSRKYKPGEKLPTVRELAVQLGINYNTVNKVYQDLEREGFITTRRGRGTFVSELDQKMLLAMDNKVELLADELVRNAFELGMTSEEIVAVIKARVTHVEMLEPGTTDAQLNTIEEKERYAG